MRHLKLFEQLFESQYKVLHGTTADFDKFELGKQISTPTYNASPDNGLGIFFTDNKTMAEWFAGTIDYDVDKEKYAPTGKTGKVIKAKIEIKKPYVIDESHPEYDEDFDPVQIYFSEIEKAGGADKYRDKLQKQGYDGIILRGCTTNLYADGSYSVFVVFDPAQAEMNESYICGVCTRVDENNTLFYNHWDKEFKAKDLLRYLVDDLGFFRQSFVDEMFDKYGISNDAKVAWVSSDTKPNERKGMSIDSYNRSNDVPETDITDVYVDGENGFVVPELSDGKNSYLFVVQKPDDI